MTISTLKLVMLTFCLQNKSYFGPGAHLDLCISGSKSFFYDRIQYFATLLLLSFIYKHLKFIYSILLVPSTTCKTVAFGRSRM